MMDPPMAVMEKVIAGSTKEVLVDLVKFAQKNGLRGSSGGWKEFLAVYDKKFGAGLSDPTKRSEDILEAFLKTFTDENDVKIFSNLTRRDKNIKAIERFIKNIPDQESPEQKLVRLTVLHPQYAQSYSFPFIDEGWVVPPLGKVSKAMKSNVMIAIDCEMVLCEDGSEAVVKVCAVDRSLKVILDELVKPDMPIADYRTSITGICSDDLQGVSCSLIDVQKMLKKMLLFGTILVGHGLHNDLRALKIYHSRVIDTSFIFKFKDLPASYVPSLNNLCKSVLGYHVREKGEPHDCLNDAKAAMKLVVEKLEHGYDDPIEITCENIEESDHSKLLIHRIPLSIPSQELLQLFSSDCKADVNVNSHKGQYYSAFAVFKDSEEADEAFRRIEGQRCKDSSGRLQKQVKFKDSKTGQIVSIKIRKIGNNAVIQNYEAPNARTTGDMDEESQERNVRPNYALELKKQNALENHDLLEDMHEIEASEKQGAVGNHNLLKRTATEKNEATTEQCATENFDPAEDTNHEFKNQDLYGNHSSKVRIDTDINKESKSQRALSKCDTSKKRVTDGIVLTSKDHSVTSDDSLIDGIAEGTFEISKRQKTCLNQCDHVAVISKLQQKLQQREEEIFNLQKVVSTLIMKRAA